MGCIESLLKEVTRGNYDVGMESDDAGYQAGEPWEDEDDEGGTGTPLDDISDEDLFGEDDEDDDEDDY